MLLKKFALVAAGIGLATAAFAQSAPKYPLQQFKLNNGLKVILSEDHSAPVVTLVVAYDVGSRDEEKGRTGFAHLFEHMMFQGSAHVPRGEHMRLVGASGGTMNGFTRTEDTTYYETVPAEKLPLALWLEADRMRSLNVTAENLKNQQEVVKEEKRLRLDNQPYVNARIIRINELAFSNYANQHSTIGSMEDLDAATLADVQSFFKTFYAPNNATMVIVGDFNPKVVRKLITDYYGGVAKQPQPVKVDLTETKQSAEKREVFNDALARFPALTIAWHGPSLGDQDSYAMDLLGDLLYSGASSRAYQELVKGKQVALAVQGGLQSQRGPSLFELFAVYKPGVTQKAIEDALYAEIEALKENPPTEEELNRVKAQYRAGKYRGGQISGLESIQSRAIEIADAAVFQKDPNLINTEMFKYMAVTPEQIQAVARKYFTQENRSVLEIKPSAPTTRPAQGGGK